MSIQPGSVPTNINYPGFSFVIDKKSSSCDARTGFLTTPHGVVETPAFIFCATKAAIKGLNPKQMAECGTQIILSNTYHLMVQPGADYVEAMGGLHEFTGWSGPMFTDSGGFQIFSMGHGSVADEIKGRRDMRRNKSVVKITEKGAVFRSYVDGRQLVLTPEQSMEIQRKLGPDLIVVLDECTPFHVNKAYTARSMRMSHRWGDRCLTAFEKTHTGKQALYGIIQGGVYRDLRQESAEYVNSRPFFANAVGGSLGSTREEMHDIVGMTMSFLDKSRPTHLLGIGGIDDIWNGIRYGIDTFDCVSPTRLARHGWALARKQPKERLNLLNACHKMSKLPIEPDCGCYTCTTFTRGYLHHLFKAGEILGIQLLAIHNVTFMNRLLAAVRQAIRDDRIAEERRNWLYEG